MLKKEKKMGLLLLFSPTVGESVNKNGGHNQILKCVYDYFISLPPACSNIINSDKERLINCARIARFNNANVSLK